MVVNKVDAIEAIMVNFGTLICDFLNQFASQEHEVSTTLLVGTFAKREHRWRSMPDDLPNQGYLDHIG